ncbi:MAG: DUF2513 domain-containing protein [Planctomycetota bacterium]|nr:DUF2513 domain-containing protein [Planctomycetota bacterium]
MKRDMDLVRKILLAIEGHDHSRAPKQIKLKGYADEQIQFHVWLMGRAGLLDVSEVSHSLSTSHRAIPRNITWEGYEFLELARQDSLWEKAKRKVSEAGAGLTLDVIKGVLAQLAKEAVGLS